MGLGEFVNAGMQKRVYFEMQRTTENTLLLITPDK